MSSEHHIVTVCNYPAATQVDKDAADANTERLVQSTLRFRRLG